MSNHVHVIMQSNKGDLSGLVRDFKKFTSRKILARVRENYKERRKEWLNLIFRNFALYNKRCEDFQLWTHYNHAVEIENDYILHNCMEYIHLNPVKAGIVDLPEEYIYSSARNYSERKALIEIDEY